MYMLEASLRPQEQVAGGWSGDSQVDSRGQVILDSWDQLPAVVEQSKGKAQTMADNSVQFWSQLREAKKKEVRTEVINSIMSQND